MRVAIMQPTFMPWLGYFDMMNSVDLFMFLDNVQFEKKSWQNRNRIKGSQGELMLTVPVRSAGRFTQLISETEIAFESNFARKHLNSISFSYSRAPKFDEVFPQVREVYRQDLTLLADFNLRIIEVLREMLGVSTPLLRTSELSAEGRSTELTVRQLREVGASEFLAAPGSRSYVEMERGFEKYGIRVLFHEYKHPSYPQLGSSFTSHLSALDLVLHTGRDSARVLREGSLGR